MPRPLPLLLFACTALFGVAAAAQDGRDLTDEARRQYVQGLKEAAALVKDRQFANAQAIGASTAGSLSTVKRRLSTLIMSDHAETAAKPHLKT